MDGVSDEGEGDVKRGNNTVEGGNPNAISLFSIDIAIAQEDTGERRGFRLVAPFSKGRVDSTATTEGAQVADEGRASMYSFERGNVVPVGCGGDTVAGVDRIREAFCPKTRWQKGFCHAGSDCGKQGAYGPLSLTILSRGGHTCTLTGDAMLG